MLGLHSNLKRFSTYSGHPYLSVHKDSAQLLQTTEHEFSLCDFVSSIDLSRSIEHLFRSSVFYTAGVS